VGQDLQHLLQKLPLCRFFTRHGVAAGGQLFCRRWQQRRRRRFRTLPVNGGADGSDTDRRGFYIGRAR